MAKSTRSSHKLVLKFERKRANLGPPTTLGPLKNLEEKEQIREGKNAISDLELCYMIYVRYSYGALSIKCILISSQVYLYFRQGRSQKFLTGGG